MTTDLQSRHQNQTEEDAAEAQSPTLSLLTWLPLGFAQAGPRRCLLTWLPVGFAQASCIPESVGMFAEFRHCPQHLLFGSVTSGLSVLLGSGHPGGPRPTAFLIQLGWGEVRRVLAAAAAPGSKESQLPCASSSSRVRWRAGGRAGRRRLWDLPAPRSTGFPEGKCV